MLKLNNLDDIENINKYQKQSLNLKIKHCQFGCNVIINNGYNKIISTSLTSAKENKIMEIKSVNTKLYEDNKLQGGYQYLNTDQILVIDNNTFNKHIELNQNNICDNIHQNIIKNNDVLELFEKPSTKLLAYFEHYDSHLKYHEYVKDYTCKFCIEVITLSNSAEGRLICEFFKFPIY